MNEEKNENVVGGNCGGIGEAGRDAGGIRVVSLFDGISVFQNVLKDLGVPVESYVAVEIDKFARKVTKDNFPDTIFFEDVRTFGIKEINELKLEGCDILIWGSPCVSYSNLGLKQGLAGKSGLVKDAVRILNKIKPRHFIMENVNMKKEFRDEISEMLGVEPILLDSSLLGSAQKRLRNIWSSFPIKQPEANQYPVVEFQNIIENGFSRTQYARTLTTGTVSESESGLARTLGLSKFGAVNNVIFSEEHVAKMPPQQILEHFQKNKKEGVKINSTSFGKNGVFRVPSPVECERLMGLPDGYTSSCSKTQRYRQLGNAFCSKHFNHILLNSNNIDKLLNLLNK